MRTGTYALAAIVSLLGACSEPNRDGSQALQANTIESSDQNSGTGRSRVTLRSISVLGSAPLEPIIRSAPAVLASPIAGGQPTVGDYVVVDSCPHRATSGDTNFTWHRVRSWQPASGSSINQTPTDSFVREAFLVGDLAKDCRDFGAFRAEKRRLESAPLGGRRSVSTDTTRLRAGYTYLKISNANSETLLPRSVVPRPDVTNGSLSRLVTSMHDPDKACLIFAGAEIKYVSVEGPDASGHLKFDFGDVSKDPSNGVFQPLGVFDLTQFRIFRDAARAAYPQHPELGPNRGMTSPGCNLSSGFVFAGHLAP
jgi:hypothetical protein